MNEAELLAVVEEKITLFNEKVKEDLDFAEIIGTSDRTVSISISDGDNYVCELKDGVLSPVKKSDDTVTSDISLESDFETIGAILNNEMSPMKAYVKQKLSVNASFRDLMLLRQLLS